MFLYSSLETFKQVSHIIPSVTPGTCSVFTCDCPIFTKPSANTSFSIAPHNTPARGFSFYQLSLLTFVCLRLCSCLHASVHLRPYVCLFSLFGLFGLFVSSWWLRLGSRFFYCDLVLALAQLQSTSLSLFMHCHIFFVSVIIAKVISVFV